jgi:hypothetical protein
MGYSVVSSIIDHSFGRAVEGLAILLGQVPQLAQEVGK